MPFDKKLGFLQSLLPPRLSSHMVANELVKVLEPFFVRVYVLKIGSAVELLYDVLHVMRIGLHQSQLICCRPVPIGTDVQDFLGIEGWRRRESLVRVCRWSDRR